MLRHCCLAELFVTACRGISEMNPTVIPKKIAEEYLNMSVNIKNTQNYTAR